METHNGIIIGFSGKMKSGKTTAADYLVNGGNGFEKRSFAEALRKITAYAFQVSEKKLSEQDFKRSEAVNGVSWREVLIRTGQFFRSIDPHFWIRRLDWSGRNIVVDDVRFINEAEKIRSLGGYVVRIEREGVPLLDDISETELDAYSFDAVVINNEGFDALFGRVDEVVNKILEERGAVKLRVRDSVVEEGLKEADSDG